MRSSRYTDPRWSLATLVVPIACLLVVCASAVALPLAQELARRTGVDFFGWLGTVPTVSIAKVSALWSLAIVLAAVATATCAVAFVNGARLPSIAGFAVSAAVLTPPIMLRSAIHPALDGISRRFAWREIAVGIDLSEWEPGGALRRSLRSFADVQRTARAAYSADVDVALRVLGNDSTLRRAAFFTAVASQWWGPGNIRDRRRVGCVRQNESSNHQAVPERQVTFALYRDAEIGCCDDFSHMLKLMLDADGIPNRLVMSAGHAFNEAAIGGQRYLLDPTNAMVVSTSWEAVNHGTGMGTVAWFPLGAARPGSRLYRPTAEVERIRLVMLMLQGGFATRYIDRLPTFLNDDHVVDGMVEPNSQRSSISAP
jgi:hypothetical protein